MVTLGLRRRFLLPVQSSSTSFVKTGKNDKSNRNTARIHFRASPEPGSIDWRATRPVRYTQAFLSADPHLSMSVRIEEEGAFLTLSCQPEGLMNPALEYPIPAADAHHLLASCRGPRLERVSRRFFHGGYRWQVDEYQGDNAGLVIAEVEIASVESLESGDLVGAFEPPSWVGEEITGDQGYEPRELLASPFVTRAFSALRVSRSPAALQPCPFCGASSAVELSDTETLGLLDARAWVFRLVVCQPGGKRGGCGAHGPWADYPEDAADLWNRRCELKRLAQVHVPNFLKPALPTTLKDGV